ncbi:MAG TPA: MBL fold metallo-hydrolase [Bryobacteraceae bacterium]|jgi:glyoxylase-like metal-dependent hydrolase (beta-lactamase superfamily II)
MTRPGTFRISIVGLFGLLLVMALGQQTETTNRVRQLAPGVYFRQGDRDRRQPANTSWIIFRDYVVVIDANTPWGIREILPEIRKTTDKTIRYVFDTHYHWDHTWGNSVMVDAGAIVVCSHDCTQELRTKGKQEWNRNPTTGEYNLTPYRLEQPAIEFGDFLAFDDGERRLELRRVGPAHTIGDAVAYLPKEGILFTGDLCVNWRSGNNLSDRDADPVNWVRVLNDLATWNVKTVIPGHGAPGTVETLRTQSAFIDDLWVRVSAGKRAGKTADQLAQELDLTRHGDFAADVQQNRAAIRAVFAKVPDF